MTRAGVPDRDRLAQVLRKAIAGEVRFDARARALYSTDASNYRQVPIGVVLPRTLADVEAAVGVCRDFGAPLTSRGGGTSLAGQCCNSAVIIDFSKHLNRVLELDPDAASAWVEPGCVLDDLRGAAARHGLTFGPDPATHNRNTLGGMVGNNSCGVHSVMAGRTADNIEALEILTYDGQRFVVEATPERQFADILREGGRRGEIYAGLAELRERYADRIRARFPRIPRRVSGFNLDELLPENGFHVARSLVGTEGTCVTVLRVKCRLISNPEQRALAVLGFPDVFASADAVPMVLKAGPIGLEGIDERLVEDIRRRHIQDAGLSLLPQGRGWLIAEFGGVTQRNAKEQAEAMLASLNSAHAEASGCLFVDRCDQDSIWHLREAALGATAHEQSIGETHEGWEDAAVPPDRLGAYLRDFYRLLKTHGYRTSLYGHFGDGCIHCRINFDFRSAEGLACYRRFIEEAGALVVGYGGSLSGEHGDGQARAHLLPLMFGDDLVAAFREFKRLWDPAGQMNPGKVVDAYSPIQNMREGPDYRPWSPATRLAFGAEHGSFADAANRCVGVGACRKRDVGVMCPSYIATRDEAHSTRGRARLLFEMTRGEVIRDGWRSTAVHEALDLCLACKACKSECPVRVDMANYKAEFMHHHYAGRLRPRSAYSMGLIWWWARAASRTPRVLNAVMKAPLLSDTAKWLGGFSTAREIPPFAAPSFRRWFGTRAAPPARATRGRILLWPDTFNTYFTPAPLQAAVALLENEGWRVEIPAVPLCCGRPLYAFGFLDRAERLWKRTLAQLRPYIRERVPIVGVEPACIAAFRDELRESCPRNADAQQLSEQVKHLSEFLDDQHYKPPHLEGRAMLHLHCHHRAVLGGDAETKLLREMGLAVDVADTGCCGMAGDFGFRKESFAVSMRVAEDRFLPALRKAQGIVVASGFSCREQARQSLGVVPLTLPEILLRAQRSAPEVGNPT